MRISPRLLAAALAAAPMAAASAQQPGPPAAAPGQQPKTIAAATASSRKLDGLFPLYQDTVTGAVHLLVKEDQLGKEFIHFNHVLEAPVSTGGFRGQFRGTNVFTIRRNFNKLEFVRQNSSFWFDPANPLSRAASANISPSILSSQEVVARDAARGEYLVKADEVFLAEVLAQVKPSPFPGAPPGQFSLGSLSRSKTRYAGLHNYPANTDVEVEYVYENPAPVNGGDPGVTDARNVSVRVRHSLIQMPENGYRARYDDPRVGFFTTQVTDLTSTSATPYRDLVNRWNLVKKDPSAAVSEPVEPIVYWIENTTPTEFRETIRAATLKWNEAFEAAGFRNAVEVKVQPDDADWDAGDIRYNVIRWTSSPVPPFGGYGPRFVNPRTGQILGADIMLEYVFMTARLREGRVFATAATALAEDPAAAAIKAMDPDACTLGEALHHSALFAAQTARAYGASEMEVDEKLKSALYYLVLHEVGHTLGLTHNMKASQMLSPAQVRDAASTARTGLYGSVMDYPAVNVAKGAATPVQAYTTAPGPYDRWAITFGYSPAMDDAGPRSALLARSAEPALAYGNDADDMRSPGGGIDPRVNIWDLTSDAIGYAADRFELVRDVLGRIRTRYSTPGQSHHELRSAYLLATGEAFSAASVVSRYVGGVYVDRAVVGQPGATRPFTPVPRAEQERAMAVLARYVFAPDAFDAQEDLYAYLQNQRRGFNHGAAPEDPRIHGRALNLQRTVLEHLLHPVVLGRLVDTRLYGNGYPLNEMMADLTRAAFQADAAGTVNSFRQNLQVEYVTRLSRMVASTPTNQYDSHARSAALVELRRVRSMLAGKRAGDAATVAHTGYVVHLVDRALDAD